MKPILEPPVDNQSAQSDEITHTPIFAALAVERDLDCRWVVGPIPKLGGHTCRCDRLRNHVGDHACPCGSWWGGCGRDLRETPPLVVVDVDDEGNEVLGSVAVHDWSCEAWCNHCSWCGKGIFYGSRCHEHPATDPAFPPGSTRPGGA